MKIILLIGLFFLISCEVTNKAASSSSLFSQTQQQKAEIVFLFFEVEQNANGNPNVKLVEKKNTDGFMKIEQPDTRREHTNSYYKISLLDDQSKELKFFLIEDPLSPVFESYSPEGMQKEKASFRKSEFSVRYNNDMAISHIIIERIQNDNKQTLLTQKL